MMALTTLRLCVSMAILLMASPFVRATDFFNASHVRYVDHDTSTGNFVFRSGGPYVDPSYPRFAWDEITAVFAERAQSQGLYFNSTYYMVDLCLLTDETDDIALEREYFDKNPSKGVFIHWPIYGINVTYVQSACAKLGIPQSECTSEQPGTFTEANRKLLSQSFETYLNGDQLPERLKQAHFVLTNPSNKQTVALGHCECGCDRTGEFFASYYMKYQNKTFTEAMTYDVGVPDRNIGYGNQVAAQWYCNYLYYTGQYTDRPYDCNNCSPFRCSPDGAEGVEGQEGVLPVSPRTASSNKLDIDTKPRRPVSVTRK